jgi:hypothetical protein
VTIPYIPLFLALLLAYMAYSEWARLDSRFLVVAALVLLVATAMVDASGAIAAADTLAVYVFFLLAGGVALLFVDHLRERAGAVADRPRSSAVRPWQAEPAEPAEERQGAAEQSLERPE